MKISRHILSLPLISAIAIPAMIAPGTLDAEAQLHESVSVDGTYLRDVLHPDRLNQLPRLTRFRIGDSPLEYALQGVPANFSPLSPALPATAWGAQRDAESRLGYLDLSCGSYLNSALYFGVGILRQPDQRLDLRLQHNSTSLWKPYGDISDPRKSYDENLGLSYARRFAGAGTLSLSAQYHLGYFNYYGINPGLTAPSASSDSKFHFPTQTLNDAALKAEWNSTHDDPSLLSWHASAGARYFGTRTATRETDINLAGGVAKRFADVHCAGIDADLNTLIYSEARDGVKPAGYTALSLTPFYGWQRGAVQLHVGADLDFTFNADGKTEGKHYGAFHAAPDVRFDISSRNAGFYIHLLGGTELHTLAAMWQLDPYRNPHLESTMPVYTPLDAVIGGEFTPFRGFTAGVAVRYKVSQNVPMEGWYMAALNYGHNAMPGLDIPAGISPAYGMSLERYNLSGLQAEVKLRYNPMSIIDIHAEGSYSPQNGKTGVFNGLDRARWILDAGFSISPVKQFSLGVDYEYRGVRRIYTGYYDPSAPTLTPGGAKPDPSAKDEMKLASLRLPDICRLSAHAAWNVTPSFSIRVEADNLLGRRFTVLPMTPTEGITVTGGLQWLF